MLLIKNKKYYFFNKDGLVSDFQLLRKPSGIDKKTAYIALDDRQIFIDFLSKTHHTEGFDESKFIEALKVCKNNDIKELFLFYESEPLISKDILYKAVDLAKSSLKGIQISIISNFLLVDKDIIKFLKNRNIKVYFNFIQVFGRANTRTCSFSKKCHAIMNAIRLRINGFDANVWYPLEKTTFSIKNALFAMAFGKINLSLHSNRTVNQQSLTTAEDFFNRLYKLLKFNVLYNRTNLDELIDKFEAHYNFSNCKNTSRLDLYFFNYELSFCPNNIAAIEPRSCLGLECSARKCCVGNNYCNPNNFCGVYFLYIRLIANLLLERICN